MNNKKGQKTGTAMTVLEITRVSVNSSRYALGTADSASEEFLENSGFADIKAKDKKTHANSPQNGLRFLVEFDAAHPGNQKPARIISVKDGAFKAIEAGRAIYISDATCKNGCEVYLRGDNLADWEIQCAIPDRKISEAYRLKSMRQEIVQPPPKLVEEVKVGKTTAQEKSAATLPPDTKQKAPAPAPVTPVVPQKPRADVPVSTPAPTARITTPTAPPSVNGVRTEQVLLIPIEEVVCFQASTVAPEITGQPRREFIQDTLESLAASIKEIGQITPGVVKPATDIPGKKFEIIAGERRYRACLIAKVPYYRAIMMHPKDKIEQLKWSLTENFHREDPNPLDTSNSLQELVNAGMTRTEIAQMMGRSVSHVDKFLAIQTLHPELKEKLKASVPDAERIRLNAAEVLAKVAPHEQQRIWGEAKLQPTQGMLIAKIQEMGRGLFVYKRGRSPSRWLEGAEVTKRVNARFGRIKMALLELNGLTEDELVSFLTHLKEHGGPGSDKAGEIGGIDASIKSMTDLRCKFAKLQSKLAAKKT